MPQTIEIKIPDIGDFKEVAVIEVLVKPGDVIKAEDSIVTLESEKASMDVPAPSAGTVKAVKVKVGDMVAEGTVVLTLEASDAKAAPASKPAPVAKAAVPSCCRPRQNRQCAAHPPWQRARHPCPVTQKGRVLRLRWC